MDDFTFRVLGPVTILRQGRSVASGGRRTLTLLTGLLLSANEIVPVPAIVDWIWGEELPAHPRAALHNLIARLRSHLDQELIEATPTGYRIATDMQHLDLLKFRYLTAAATDCAARGRREEAASLMAEAISLWREPLLGNIESPTLCRDETGRLAELYLNAQEKHAELCLQLGWHESAVRALAPAVRAHPFREPLVGHLMVALLGSGRRADALMAYETLRRALRDELGVDPCPDLQRLHVRMLRSAPERRPAPRESCEPNAVRVPTRDLPAVVGKLYGRARELRELGRQLSGHERSGPGDGLIAIVGPAGVGKTALAVRGAVGVPGLFPGGHVYLDLRGYDENDPLDTATALSQLISSVRAAPTAMPADEPGRKALYRSLIAGRRMLVILDNARDESQVRPLLPGAAATCTTIVTSRSQLRGLVARDGACRIGLAGIPAPAGRALLADLSGRPLGSRQSAVTSLVTLCDGLPLALRIVAERLARKGQAPGAVLSEVRTPGRVLDLFDSGEGTTDMRTILSWSYKALDATAARTYQVLGRHDSPRLSLPAAAALLGQSEEASRRLLDRLVEVHLVDQRGPGRYWFSELARAHARECSAERGRPSLIAVPPAS